MGQKYEIPAEGSYLDFLDIAETIDDLFGWIDGGIVTGTYVFKLDEEDKGAELKDSKEVRFVLPNLAAPDNGVNKFLRTSDDKFLCIRRDENGE